MCFMPYGKQVLFHISFSICATVFVGFGVFQCNFVEVTSGWDADISGASIGFWKAQAEINGITENPQRFNCVGWTDEQESRLFDAAWNYGKYGGVVIFSFCCLVTYMLTLTMCMELHPKTEKRIAILQFTLSVMSALMLLALRSDICQTYVCWIDIGAVLTIAASVILLVGGWITLSLRYETEDAVKTATIETATATGGTTTEAFTNEHV